MKITVEIELTDREVKLLNRIGKNGDNECNTSVTHEMMAEGYGAELNSLHNQDCIADHRKNEPVSEQFSDWINYKVTLTHFGRLVFEKINSGSRGL